MDIQQVKAQLQLLQSKVQQLEDATHSEERKPSIAPLQGQVLKNLRDMQIAVGGTSKYFETLRLEPLKFVVMLTAVRSGIVRTLAEARGKPLSARSIAATCDLDEGVVIRTMRFMSSILGICDDAGVETYKSNKLTEILDIPLQKASIDFTAAFNRPAVGNFPKFLADTGIQQLGKEPTPLNHHFGGTLWEVLERDPGMKNVFDRFFATRAQKLQYSSWDVYPVAPILEGTSAEVLMVDIGGGRGHDLKDLVQKYPEYASARLVLQDLPHTINGIDPESLPPNIEKQAYDFFSGPQPIKGAAAYYMHDIMHDHSDENCSIILKRTAEAMWSDSRLLVRDWVIRDQNAQQIGCYIDWSMMMVTSGGMERSLSQWTPLLAGAGLEIVKVWAWHEEAQSVIEAMLKKGGEGSA